MITEAIELASKMFKHKTDKGGVPYIFHCLYVMFKASSSDEDLMVAGVLHDILEDTDITTEDLIGLKFSSRSIQIIQTLTHDSRSSYMDYIKVIGCDKDATKIKLADLEHNSQITKIKGLTKKDFDRLEKYCIAYTYLSDINQERK